MAYWSWADIYETNRGRPACRDGILNEGLVDVDRNPRGNLEVFRRKAADPAPPAQPAGRLEVTGRFSAEEGAAYQTIAMPAGTDSESWKALLGRAEDMLGHLRNKARRLTCGPALPEDLRSIQSLPVDLRKGRPVVLEASAGPLEIRVDAEADALHFIGQASIGHGYPMMGEREEAARYEIVFDDGEIQTVPLRNGVEFASAFGLLGPSRIDPAGVTGHACADDPIRSRLGSVSSEPASGGAAVEAAYRVYPRRPAFRGLCASALWHYGGMPIHIYLTSRHHTELREVNR